MKATVSKFRAAAQRSSERRRREDDAPRLSALIPALTSMRLEVVERVPNGTTKYVKLVVVARAPALFVLPCGDSTCQDGGHDITSGVIAALRSRRTDYAGESSCDGSTGSAPCSRSISYRIHAEYATAKAPGELP